MSFPCSLQLRNKEMPRHLNQIYKLWIYYTTWLFNPLLNAAVVKNYEGPCPVMCRDNCIVHLFGAESN